VSGRTTQRAEALPLVSIVTSSLNQGRFIEETILSVLGQDYPAIEYLVMDGGSTDETLAILERHSDRLIFVSEKDCGHAHAVNKGFQRARGEILAFLNSDDTYLPGAVSAAVAALQKNPEAPFVYGEGYYVDEYGCPLDRYPTERFSSQRLQDTCFICQPTAFVRREALQKAGYVNEELRCCFDYELWVRLSSLGEPVYLDRLLAHYRLHSSSRTICERRATHWEVARMWKRRIGQVPSSWIFALAHVILETRLRLDRSKSRQDAAFLLAVSCLSAWLFIYFNHRVRRDEWRQIVEWLSMVARAVRKAFWKRASRFWAGASH